MKKKIITGALAVFLGMFMVGCEQKNKETINLNEKEEVNIMVSIYPLKEFAEKIGGDKVKINSMVPNNMEPHDYEPKTKDFENLINSKAFIYNGLGMEEWVEQVKEVIKDESVVIVDSSEGVDVRKQDGAIDPHSWLSLKQAQVQSKNIKDTLVEIDPENKDYYETNYNNFKKELEDLYNEYADKFAELENKDFITGHSAFGYLCRDFGLEQRSVENLFGEGEPTPKQLEDLVVFCKENNIKTIFSESLASPKVSETLALEVGAEVVPIYTLESQEDDKSYLEAMRYNLDEIYKCLKSE